LKLVSIFFGPEARVPDFGLINRPNATPHGLLLTLAFTSVVASSALAEPGPRQVVVLRTSGTAQNISEERLRLVLSLQLEPFSIQTVFKDSTPSAAGDHLKRGAIGVVWFRIDQEHSEPVLSVFILERALPKPVLHTQRLGPPTEGIERSIALAVRASLRGHLVLPQSTVDPPKPPDITPVKRWLPTLWIQGGYTAGAFVPEKHVRHGPELALGVNLSESWEAKIGASYAFPLEDRQGEALIKRSVWSACAVVQRSLLHLPRLRLMLGPMLRVGYVTASARRDSGATDSEAVIELSLGANVEALLEISKRIVVAWGGVAAWLPVAHRVDIGTDSDLEGARWELRTWLGLRVVLF